MTPQQDNRRSPVGGAWLTDIRRRTADDDEWSNAMVIRLLDHIDALTAERDALRTTLTEFVDGFRQQVAAGWSLGWSSESWMDAQVAKLAAAEWRIWHAANARLAADYLRRSCHECAR